MFQTMTSTEPDIELQKVCAPAETPYKEMSPDSKCPICLDRFRNVSYADKCFHRFCFRCILEWGKNKAECPLCKQPFGAMYHSVRSEHDFKVYELRPAENGSFGSVQGQRFRYRTTLTHERRRAGQTRGSSRQQEVVRFRRWLYRCDVRVHGVRDGGRSRDTSAEFFRKNPACLHRLVPWLKRELAVLYGSHDSVVDVILHVILSLITRHDIQDEAFLQELRPFLSSRTEHFLHEFLSFARSPFNMEAYDHHAVYDCPAPSHLSAVSEDDGDLSSAPSPWDDETPGPSYSSATNSVFTVTISDSDADSASEEEEAAESISVNATSNVTNSQADEDDYSSDGGCVIVGFIKPTAQRTPVLVQLSSDSEASVQEAPEPSTSKQSDLRDLTNRRSRNTDDVLSHSATKQSCNRRYRSRGRSRESYYFKQSHRRRSHLLSYKDRRKRSKATNHCSRSHTSRHRHSRYTNTHYSQDTPQPSCTHSRSKTHSCSRSRTLLLSWCSARARSRSRSRARSRSRGHVHTYSGSWRTQSSPRDRKRSECLSVSPAPSSHRRSSHDKACGKRKHKSLHGERRRRSKDKHHHPKKKKKKRRRRRSSSMEVGAECRKHHHKKKKHKTERKNRIERMGRSSELRSHAVITIHTDAQPAEEGTPPRHAATTNTEPLGSFHSTPTSCPTSHNCTALSPAPNETFLNDAPTLAASSHAPNNSSRDSDVSTPPP